MCRCGPPSRSLALCLLAPELALAQTRACGDLNSDGQVNGRDGDILREHAAARQTLTTQQSLLCNVIDEVELTPVGDFSDPAASCSLVDVAVMERNGFTLGPGPGDSCPGGSDGECCLAHGGLGCAVLATAACVCAIDPTCCTVGWDGICAQLACSGPCGTGQACPLPAPEAGDVPDSCDDATCCPAGLAIVAGSPLADVLVGGAANECLVGLGGGDSLNGGNGNDTLLGGDDADTALPGSAGNDTLLGARGNDTLAGGLGCDLVAGGAGNDVLHGDAGNDTLVPGIGQDAAFGESGHDLFVVRSACEISAPEHFNGGTGIDTIRSPYTAAQLAALGLTTLQIEAYAVVPKPGGQPDGACYTDTDGKLVCDCCENGFDPATQCESCPPGFHEEQLPEDPGDGDGLAPAASPTCVPDLTCSDLDCGAHGTCVEVGDEARCECECGYSGANCDECQAPWEPDGVGGCYLGETCGQELCSGNGACVEQEGCQLACQCDEGWESGSDCSGPRIRIGGPNGAIIDLGSSASQYAVGLAGATCTGDFEWSIVEGNGTLLVSPADSKRVTLLSPHPAPGLPLDTVVLRAECENDSNLAAEYHQTLILPPGGTALQGEVEFVEGVGSSLLEPLDRAMLAYMDDHDMPGGTLAVTFQEQLVYLRAYGVRNDLPLPIQRRMRTCTPMRVASVTKPFTRALVANDLYGMPIPAALGGGTVQPTDPVVQTLAGPMQIGPGQTVSWQAGAGFYSATYPQIQCSTNDGLLNPRWSQVTLDRLMRHRAGVWPNGSYLAGDSGKCTGAANENCLSSQNVADPMTSSSNLTGIANTLSLDHGVVTVDDILQFTAGLCLYDEPTVENFRYSNFGYAALGRVYELVRQRSWESGLLALLNTRGVLGPGAGNAFLYQGQNDGSGPATGSVPEHLRETKYWSSVSSGPDVTNPVLVGPTWTYPNIVDAPYGVLNMDVMYAHGGIATNVETLVNFMHEFEIDDGTLRDAAQGGEGYTVYENNNDQHGGLLWGTDALMWEVSDVEPQNANNPNGAGCLVPANIADPVDPTLPLAKDQLSVVPCPLPPGIRVAVIFNKEPIAGGGSYVAGLHGSGLLGHRLRAALAAVGDATVWASLPPLDPEDDRRVGCDLTCPPDAPFCVPITCGNGALDPPEVCDDGNNTSGDGCEADCRPPAVGPDEPGGYAACAAIDADPGTCLGGPCALIAGKNADLANPADSDVLDFYGATHPDGDHHPDYFCWDNLSDGDFPWTEATCTRDTVQGDKFGVCEECGVGGHMVGCLCPNPNGPDDGCGNDLTCIGGRCYPDTPEQKPAWMCSAECADIYGPNQGYCLHDSLKGAVCYPFSCDEPAYPVPWCDYKHGAVCDPAHAGCVNDSCCVPECLDHEHCDELNYVGHMCTVTDRCSLYP